MLLRSLLLALFLFQWSVSPLIASSVTSIHLSSKSSDSKHKHTKSDVLEEDEDENETKFKNQLDPAPLHSSFVLQRHTILLKLSHTAFARLVKGLANNIPIILWVQNFRI